jgi:multicomponent K+:H+ antiporter subunit E
MKRIPPVLTLLLVVMWALLNNSASIGTLLLGLIIATLLMLAAAQLRPVQPRLRRLWIVIPLICRVIADVVHSNIGVGRIVLGLVRDRSIHSGFINIPLDLRDPHGIAILAAIITSTPGTAWAGISEDCGTLKLHILDLQDDQHWIRIIKERYEQPLIRIFE